MTDQIHVIGNVSTVKPINHETSVGGVQKAGNGEDFKNILTKAIGEVNRLQSQSGQAQIDLVTGRTDNVAEVVTSMRKSGIAFRMLMEIRNKLQEAYNEINQMRV